ncbi:putative Heat shock protein 70 family [Helianthus debilis subsp. tardiflorus]
MEGRVNQSRAIGIDLGTMYSCVGVWKHDRVEIIPNEQGNRTTPSSVAFVDDQRLIGDGAKNQETTNPANTIFDAKRLIGRRFSDSKVQGDIKLLPFKVIEGPDDTPQVVVSYKGREKEFSAEEISSMILGKMRETAEAYVGNVVKDAVVTVPAYFDDSQRQATKDAGTIAGLNIIRIINEPTAAAIAYGLDKRTSITKEMNLLIFDLGGGTFDVSVVTIEKGGNFKVLAIDGDAHLGGQDFNNRMVQHCVQEFKRIWNKDLTKNRKALGRLRNACENAKRNLSTTAQTSIEIDCLHEGIDFSMKISRAKFEELNKDLFNKCIRAVKKCLSDANIEKSSVDEIILVGGSTRIPKVQSMLQEFFYGKELCKSVNPDEVVAYGATIMATYLTLSSRSVPNVVLYDVTPLSLGIEVEGEKMSVVISRNTPIPTEKSKLFSTSDDYQSSMYIKVLQGESSTSTSNHLLGHFNIYGIPYAPKGEQDIKISFKIDANGILTVTAEILSTGEKKKFAITYENRRLSKEDIEKMVKDAKIYKHKDQEFKKRADAYNELEDFIYEMDNRVKELKIKKKTFGQSLKKMENAIAETTEWLKNNQGAPVHEVEHMKEVLQYACI